MGEYWPLYVSLGILLVVGVLVPLVVADFYDPSEIEVSGVLSPLFDFIDNGITVDLPLIGEIGINPFDWIGSLKDSLLDYISYMSMIPNILLVPLTIIMIIGIIWGLIALFKP